MMWFLGLLKSFSVPCPPGHGGTLTYMPPQGQPSMSPSKAGTRRPGDNLKKHLQVGQLQNSCLGEVPL